MDEIMLDYQKIVKGLKFPDYKSPEDQGRAIKKCSILEPIDISYSNRTYTTHIE